MSNMLTGKFSNLIGIPAKKAGSDKKNVRTG